MTPQERSECRRDRPAASASAQVVQQGCSAPQLLCDPGSIPEAKPWYPVMQRATNRVRYLLQSVGAEATTLKDTSDCICESLGEGHQQDPVGSFGLSVRNRRGKCSLVVLGLVETAKVSFSYAKLRSLWTDMARHTHQALRRAEDHVLPVARSAGQRPSGR